MKKKTTETPKGFISINGKLFRRPGSRSTLTGSDTIVRKEESFWIGRIHKIRSDENIVDVQWYGEIKTAPDHYVMLQWFESVSLDLIVEGAEPKWSWEDDKGMWKLMNRDSVMNSL